MEPASATFDVAVDIAGAEPGDTWALFHVRQVDGSTNLAPIVTNLSPEVTQVSWDVSAVPAGVYQLIGVLLHRGRMITAEATGTVSVRHP